MKPMKSLIVHLITFLFELFNHGPKDSFSIELFHQDWVSPMKLVVNSNVSVVAVSFPRQLNPIKVNWVAIVAGWAQVQSGSLQLHFHWLISLIDYQRLIDEADTYSIK